MMRRKTRGNALKGFSLVESLISLSLFFIIVMASLEFFGATRDLYLKIKNKQETKEAALAALDKMRIDLQEGGSGLLMPVQLGLIEGISENNENLILLSKEKDILLLSDLTTGQTRIDLDGKHDTGKSRMICIFDSEKGEVKTISDADTKSIILSSPLDFSYVKEKASLILLRKVSFYLDKDNQILRRKVNASPSQPLLEEVIFFDSSYKRDINLVKLRLALKPNKEKIYEITVFPKNAALALMR